MITVELNSSQVNEIVRQATGDEGLVGLLGGLKGTIESDASRYSRSLWRGLRVLAVFADRKEHGVKNVATALDGQMSTTHRYMSTLVAVGLLDRDPETRLYKLA